MKEKCAGAKTSNNESIVASVKNKIIYKIKYFIEKI